MQKLEGGSRSIAGFNTAEVITELKDWTEAPRDDSNPDQIRFTKKTLWTQISLAFDPSRKRTIFEEGFVRMDCNDIREVEVVGETIIFRGEPYDYWMKANGEEHILKTKNGTTIGGMSYELIVNSDQGNRFRRSF